jgi:hypothetical protein
MTRVTQMGAGDPPARPQGQQMTPPVKTPPAEAVRSPQAGDGTPAATQPGAITDWASI